MTCNKEVSRVRWWMREGGVCGKEAYDQRDIAGNKI